MPTDTRVCARAHAQTDTHTHTRTRTRTHARTHTLSHTHTRIHECIGSTTSMRAHTHTRTHAHTHTRTRARARAQTHTDPGQAWYGRAGFDHLRRKPPSPMCQGTDSRRETSHHKVRAKFRFPHHSTHKATSPYAALDCGGWRRACGLDGCASPLAPGFEVCGLIRVCPVCACPRLALPQVLPCADSSHPRRRRFQCGRV